MMNDRRKNRKPTHKQTLAFQKALENRGNISKAMRDAGYKSTSKNPQELTRSLGWQQLMDKYFPEKLLAKKHKKLLNKKEYIAIGKFGEREVIATGEIDASAVAKGLDMAYKLRGKYKAEDEDKPRVAKIEIVNYGDIKIEPKVKNETAA